MNTTDTVLLIIITSLMSIFFLLAIAAAIAVLKLITTIKNAVSKAESVIDSVESAAGVFKDASGPMAAFKLIKNILDLVQKHKK